MVGPSRVRGARSQTRDRTDDNRCPLVAEEGNVVSVAKTSARTRARQAPNKQAPLKRSRTRPSLGPGTRARQSPLHIRDSRGASRARWGGRFGIAVGQPCASRRNRHRGQVERTLYGSPRGHRSRDQTREVVRDASEKEGGHGHRPCEETRVPSSVLVRRNAVAEVDRQHPGLE